MLFFGEKNSELFHPFPIRLPKNGTKPTGSPRRENPGYAYYSLARTKPLESVVRLAADCDE